MERTKPVQIGMVFQFNFYSSLLLIVFLYGMLYSVLLLKKYSSGKNIADGWLALFLFLCSMYICPWMLGFAGWYDNQPYRDIIFYIPFGQTFFIGPALYLYVKSLLNPGAVNARKYLVHFVPGLLYLVYNAVIAITDLVVVGDYYFLYDQSDREFDHWYRFAGWASMMFYFAFSLRYYIFYRKVINQLVSYADGLIFRWVKYVIVAFLLMQLLQASFLLIMTIYPQFDSYTVNWWYYFFFGVLNCYIAFNGYANGIITKITFYEGPTSKEAFLSGPAVYSTEEISIETETRLGASLPPPEWKEKLTQLMETDKMYANQMLTLADVSKILGTNTAITSRGINGYFGQNFNDFVNTYRTYAVMEAIKSGQHKRETLLAIAFDCGFNSKATFNRSFKRITKLTPKEFIDQEVT